MTAALSEENTHLKEMNGRLNLKPSEMEDGTAPSLPPSGRASRRQRGQERLPATTGIRKKCIGHS
jgi:hypothetical protein